MDGPLHKDVPRGVYGAEFDAQTRYDFAQLWLREIRRRNIVVPRSAVIYVGFGVALAGFFSGLATTVPAYLISTIGIFFGGYSLFMGRVHPELSNESMSVLATKLEEKGLVKEINEIRYARD